MCLIEQETHIPLPEARLSVRLSPQTGLGETCDAHPFP